MIIILTIFVIELTLILLCSTLKSWKHRALWHREGRKRILLQLNRLQHTVDAYLKSMQAILLFEWQ